jgi:mannose-6-phosphate isomerase-like protein (cupin superfamily)
MSFEISFHNVRRIAESRKMLVAEALDGFDSDSDVVRLAHAEDLRALATRLLVSPSELLLGQDDLDDGIKVCRREQGFSRAQQRKGKLYYTYQHLATTSAAPELMALRVTVHCNDEEDVVLNAGHDSKELVYVTVGGIRMHWDTGSGVREVDLGQGDSVYLAPGIPHSFRSIEGESELLAFNYRLPA